MYIKIEDYQHGKPILFGQNTVRTPYSVQMVGTDVRPDSKAHLTVPEGSFIVGVGNSNRFLPRARLVNATATNSNAVTVGSPSQNFKVGDVLYPQAGYGEIVFSGEATSGDVISIKIGSLGVYTVTSGGTAATDVATFVTNHAAALLALGVVVTRKGTGATLVVYSRDSHPINVASTSPTYVATLVSTEPGYLGDNIIPLGTINAIGDVNGSGQRVLSLAGNAAYVVPVGVPVGVMVDKFLGIYPDPIDFYKEPVMHIAPIAECDGVYENNLPYCDMQLKRRFSDLRINPRFYKA
jgi:hypothetical protein